MMMKAAKTPQKNQWLWLALIITMGLTLWTSMQPDGNDTTDDVVSPITRIAKDTPSQANKNQSITPVIINTPSEIAQSTWQVKNREALILKPADLFPVHSWVVTAPVAKNKPAPLPIPAAPPAPFTYMGKMEDGPKGTLFFLMANNKVYSVTKGENVDPFWRLDGEDAHQLMFTFLPLNLTQTLSKTQPLNTQELPNTAASALN